MAKDYRTLTIKRYSLEELTEILNELAYQELATSKCAWECQKQIEDEGKYLLRMQLEDELTNIAVFRKRISDFTKQLSTLTNSDHVETCKKVIATLQKVCNDAMMQSIDYCEKVYNTEKNIYNTRNFLEFPLDKKINALYDDLTVCAIRYDNIATPWNNKQTMVRSFKGDIASLENFAKLVWSDDEGTRLQFLALQGDDARCAFLQEEFGTDYIDIFESLDEEGRIKFVKDNVKFTHLTLGPTESTVWSIAVYGSYDPKFTNSQTTDHTILPSNYADFNSLTLADTVSIVNNDLQQRLQSKLDIDKENLKVVAEQWVRGDNYKILEAPTAFGNGRYRYIIRYVCPSTGRVYFNAIDERSLSESRFYQTSNTDTYINAWWHINNCGEDPTEEEAVIRC